MNELPLQHAAATRWATIMLGAAIVAVALTLVVFVLPRPEVKAPEIKTQSAVPVAKAEKRLPWEGVKTDWSRLDADARNFNAPDVAAHEKDVAEQLRKAAEEAEVANASGGGVRPPESTGGGFAPTWRFLGAVIDGERRTALVVIPEADGQQRQRFVAEGFTKDEYKVVGIEPTKLIVEQGRRRHEIGLSTNTRGQGIVAGSAVPPLRTQSLGGAGATPARPGTERIRQAGRPGNPNPASPTAPGPYSPPVQPGAQDPNAVPPLPRDPDPPGTR